LLVGATIGMTGFEILGQSINELTDHRLHVVVATTSAEPSLSSRNNGEVMEREMMPSSIVETWPAPIATDTDDTAQRRVVNNLIDRHSDGVKLQELRTTDQNHIHVYLESSSTDDWSKLSNLTNDIVAALELRPEVVQANVYLDLKTTRFLPERTSPTPIQRQ
jgi:hypothetical protein